MSGRVVKIDEESESFSYGFVIVLKEPCLNTGATWECLGCDTKFKEQTGLDGYRGNALCRHIVAAMVECVRDEVIDAKVKKT